jgi:hypothetical protein
MFCLTFKSLNPGILETIVILFNFFMTIERVRVSMTNTLSVKTKGVEKW